jgi:hypothetical protein
MPVAPAYLNSEICTSRGAVSSVLAPMCGAQARGATGSAGRKRPRVGRQPRGRTGVDSRGRDPHRQSAASPGDARAGRRSAHSRVAKAEAAVSTQHAALQIGSRWRRGSCDSPEPGRARRGGQRSWEPRSGAKAGRMRQAGPSLAHRDDPRARRARSANAARRLSNRRPLPRPPSARRR